MGEAWRWGVELHSISLSLEHILSKPRMAVTFAFLMYEPDCNAVVSRGTQSIAINASYRLIHKGNCEARNYFLRCCCFDKCWFDKCWFDKCDLLKFI